MGLRIWATLLASATPMIAVSTGLPMTASAAQRSGVLGRPVVIDPYVVAHANEDANLQALSCPSTRECVAIDTSGRVTFDPVDPARHTRRSIHSSGLAEGSAVSCPSISICGLSTGGPGVATFAPRRSGDPRLKSGWSQTSEQVLSYGYHSMRCPTATECVVEDQQYAIAYNPSHPRGSVTTHLLDGQPSIQMTQFPWEQLACPTASQCTTLIPLGGEGSVRSATFNPQNGAAPALAPLGFDYRGGLGPDLACPTRTECVALGSRHPVRFDPDAPTRRDTLNLKLPIGLGQLACGSRSQCTVITISPADQTAVTFSPLSGRKIATVPLHEPTGALLLACPSARQCTTINAETGTPNAPYTGTDLTFDPQ